LPSHLTFLDFFKIGYCNQRTYISEKLKKNLEDFSGIEFLKDQILQFNEKLDS